MILAGLWANCGTSSKLFKIMAKPKSYNISPARGQALLNYQGRLMPNANLEMRLFEAETIEQVAAAENGKPARQEKELNADFGNLLLQGDCLSACAYLKSKNIKPDLVYIDPPFASGANYAKKIYLRNGQKTSFENDSASIGEEIMYGDIWQKEDYLNWLYERLLAIREVMAETASIYVHLDWHIGHYVKILMDEVFGEENFRNEIIWRYGKMASSNKKFISNHDIIFLYSKTDSNIFNVIKTKLDIPIKRLARTVMDGKLVNAKDKNGKTFHVEYNDKIIDDVWDDISIAMPASSQFVDYATQKPEALLERIIKASSDEGMIVADFFSGSGTTAKIAHDLGRKFVACDIGVNAIQTARDRLAKAGAGFEILKIKDGVRLFRNPAQTAQKIFSLVEGFSPRTDLDLGEFWDGGIAAGKSAYAPVKFIGIDKKLTKPLVDAILEEVYVLEDAPGATAQVKIIYAHKDFEVDQSYVDKEIAKAGKTTIAVELIGLDDLLAEKRDLLFAPDSAQIEVKKSAGKFRVEIKKFFSPYLKAKIDEFNAKAVKKGTLAENKEKAVKISESGRELIEAVQFDTTLKKSGVWTSNRELEDKAGPKDKIKAIYELPGDKFKIKIRNIAGDETIFDYSK